MCPAAAIAVPAAVSLLSGIMGAKSQAKQAKAAAGAAENARQGAMAAISPTSLKSTADWLFPGLVGNAPSGPAAATRPAPVPTWMNGGGTATLQSYMASRGSNMPALTRTAGANPLAPQSYGTAHYPGRAEGGPVSADKPYLVGEKGPEIIHPKQDGQVIPNDALTGADSEEPEGDEEGQTQQMLQLVIELLTQLLGGGAGAPPPGGGEMESGMGGGPPQMSGAAPMSAGGADQMPMGIEPRVGGGPVQQGRTYLAGENGPEAVVPRPGLSPTPPTPSLNDSANTTPLPVGTPPSQVLSNPSWPTPPGVSRPPTPPQPTGPRQPISNTTVSTGNSNGVDANGAPIQAPGGSSYGGLAVSQNQALLQNPGQISSVGYERAQEQANQNQATGSRAVTGGLSASGIDPNTPMGQALMASVTATAGKQRNEAARDYTLAEEQMKRQDIAAATQQYINMLSTIFGYQQSQSAAAGGQAFPQVPVTSSPWGAIGTFAGQLGSGFADMYANRNRPNSSSTGNNSIGTGPA